MQALRPTFDIDRFFSRVRSSSTRVLMLDYDGTLAPFRDRPAEAVPYPGVIPLLDTMMEAGHTRVVIVSGRWARDLLPLIRLKRRPELWGSHGWERVRTSEEYESARVGPGVAEMLVAVDEWTEEIEALGGRVENKPAGVAFHWRGLSGDRVAAIRYALTVRWAALASSNEIEWHDFDGGIEIRAAGRNKGDVVRALFAEAGSSAAIAYLGDDLTDEDAFEAVPPHGVAVLVREQLRSTAADVWIKPPDELLEFLRRWHETARGQDHKESRDADGTC
ncbi:MAG TPA: trehalose-phosphatase [Candidatus Krumholzibacteria bacterium]|nr:trehalose-phosphatase [Candidatus Krumholzibacteria bacterium]